MYDFILKENEEIKIIDDEAIIRVRDTYENVSVVITNIRLIILMLPQDIENFRFGRVIKEPMIKETIFEKPLKKIVKLENKEQYVKYIMDNNTYIYLKSNGIYDYLKKIIC